jgi:hypothetical protein
MRLSPTQKGNTFMKVPRSAVKIGIVAGLLGGASGVAIAAGLTPSLGTFQPISHEAAAQASAQKFSDGTTTTTATDDSVKAEDSARPTAAPAPATSETKSFDAAGAGTVTYKVEGDTITLVDATPASGYTVKVDESAGREIEVVFSNATQRVKAKVELENGVAREKVTTKAVDSATPAVKSDDDGEDANDVEANDDEANDVQANDDHRNGADDHHGRGTDDKGADDHGGRGRGSDG